MTHPRRRILINLLLIAIGIAPMVSVVLAGMIAEQAGCQLHEGFVQPCIVYGTDIGGVLYTMGVMGWLMLGSVFLLAGGVLGLVGEAAWAILRKIWPR